MTCEEGRCPISPEVRVVAQAEPKDAPCARCPLGVIRQRILLEQHLDVAVDEVAEGVPVSELEKRMPLLVECADELGAEPPVVMKSEAASKASQSTSLKRTSLGKAPSSPFPCRASAAKAGVHGAPPPGTG